MAVPSSAVTIFVQAKEDNLPTYILVKVDMMNQFVLELLPHHYSLKKSSEKQWILLEVTSENVIKIKSRQKHLLFKLNVLTVVEANKLHGSISN